MDEISFESTTSMSPEQFARWVEKRARRDPLHRYELLNGRVVMNPPAGFPHGEIGAQIQTLLWLYVRTHKLGKVYDSSQGFELPGGDILEPDHSFVSRQRLEQAPAPKLGEFLQVVPDLVVEVLSTSTASRDRGEKKSIYERSGVREYWLVDPRSRELTVFHLEQGRYGTGNPYTEADRFSSKAIAGLEFPVSELFP